MIKNFLIVALRNLRRNKAFSAINIIGLALGIATCLLILLFVGHELSYDRYNDNADRIVRVTLQAKMEGGLIGEANVMPPVGPSFKNDFPEVLAETRIRHYGKPRLVKGDKIFRDDAFAFVDSNFFRFFTIPLLQGDPAKALVQPNSIVITKAVARKYFGSEDVLGKTILFKDDMPPMKVTGIIDEVPENSHFHFSLFASMAGLPEANEPSWLSSNFYTYLLLPKHYDYRNLEAQLPREVDKYVGPQLQKSMGISLSDFRKAGNSINFQLQRLTDIHLHSNLTGEIEANGDIQYVYIFSVVAVFMLLIACINFMNLSTAGASKRGREVGIRKVMGSMRGQLVGQFLAESLLLTALSMGLALALVYAALPLFNDLAGQKLSIGWGAMPWLVPGLIGFWLVTGVLAGSYPAFFLSSFNPIAVLKGRVTGGKGGTMFRSVLVVFQFVISIGLIVSTVVVYRQLSYIRHQRLGYDRDQVVVIQEAYWLGKNIDAYSRELLSDPRVASVSRSGYLPAGPTNGNNYIVNPDGNASQIVKTVCYDDIDDSYIPTLGMQLAAGRNFSKDFGTDSSAVIINETAASAFGWGQNALGHTIAHTDNDGTRKVYRVIGIVKDFHFRSFHELITPLLMELGTDYSNLIVRTKTHDYTGLLADMKKKWEEAGGQAPFSYSFLDDRFDDTIKAEENIGRILGIFAGLTIFVACLGLFGLATFTAEQRTKEIGIRKVLGADTRTIVGLLSKDFVRLVGVAFLIAAPLAWLVMNRWLQDFAYRVSIGWWVFALAAGLTLVITLATISLRAVQAALANPVDSLRAE